MKIITSFHCVSPNASLSSSSLFVLGHQILCQQWRTTEIDYKHEEKSPADMNLSSSSSSSPATSWLSGIVRGRSYKPSTPRATSNSAFPGADSSVGPVVEKNQFRGVLFKYGPKPAQVACKTGDYKQQVMFIGGLTDGFMATERRSPQSHLLPIPIILLWLGEIECSNLVAKYLEPLAIALEKEKWSLVEALLSSSYTGYGTSSLAQDALELDQFISYLINKEDSEGVVLLGHSTGCLDIVHYMRTNAAWSSAVHAAILQAPVSDREYRATLPETAAMIDLV